MGGIVNLFITYWVDKWQFLRRRKEPPMIGRKMLTEMFNMLDMLPFFFVWGNLFFFEIQSTILDWNQRIDDDSGTKSVLDNY